MTFEQDKEEGENVEGKKYLEYCELLLAAKRLGIGYWCDFKDVLYLVPTPIISCNATGQYHSIEKPAIYWKSGEEIYYINGTKFDKALWKKVVSGKMSAAQVFAIENTEQRRIAYELMDKKKITKLKGFKVLDEVKDDGYGYPMRIVSFEMKGFDTPFYYLNCFCSSTGREYFVETRQTTCLAAKDKSFGLNEIIFSKEW